MPGIFLLYLAVFMRKNLPHTPTAYAADFYIKS